MPEVLKRPNWFQDIKEFQRQTKLFHEIYGEEYLYTLFPVGLTKDRTKALYSIPPNLVTQEYSGNVPFFTLPAKPASLRYYLHSDGGKKEIDKELVIFMNDNKVTYSTVTDKTVFGGESRMKGLRPSIKNIHMAYESRGVILKHRGAMGILSNRGTDGVGAGLPVDQKEVENIQNKYSQYGGLDNQYQVIITSANLQWQQMSVSPDKLGLFQETEADFNKILDSYGLPSEMFVRQSGSTYENQRQAEKNAYLRTIIPEGNEWIKMLSDSFFPNGEVSLIMDYMHLPIFHEDTKVRAETLEKMVNSLSQLLMDKIITTDEYREEIIKLGIAKG